MSFHFHDLIDHIHRQIIGRGPGEKQKKKLGGTQTMDIEAEPLVEPLEELTDQEKLDNYFQGLGEGQTIDEEKINEVLSIPPKETFGFKKKIIEKENEYNRYAGFVNSDKEDIEKTERKIEEEENKEDDNKKKKKLLSLKKKLEDDKEELEDDRKLRRKAKKELEKYINEVKPQKKQVKSLVKNLLMGAVVNVDAKIKEDKEKKKQKLYRAYKKKIIEFMEPYKSMKQMMFLQKQEYEESGKFNNMTEEEKREIKRDGKFFELLLDGPLKYVIYMITGDRGTITNNDTNEKIRKDLRMYAVFDLSQKTADIECKCFVCNAYNRSSTGEIVLQKSKIEGNIGFKPYYIVVDGEVKLYNVWNERESKWVNKDFYKDTYVVFLLTDGIYKFNIIDYGGFEIGNEATVGGIEDLFTLKSKIPYVKKDFEGTKQEVVVLDNSKLIKIY
jgi:hypothetical protein